ncbi:MAG: outer membrane protein assembly factor BamD [Candidatus Omnitrophota bacterium]
MKGKGTFNSIAGYMLIIAMLAFIGTGCSHKKAETEPETLTDKELYEQAKGKIKHNPEKARMLFKEVMHLYPDSIYARRAKIGIADSYFGEKDSGSLLMAAAEYDEYVNLYPNSPDSVYAKYQNAMCYFEQIKKPGRDQTNTLLAVKALENMIKLYPDTQEAKDAKLKLEKCRQILAEHYFGIGFTNFRMGALKGASERYRQIIDEYPDYTQNDKLFYYTGLCYFRMQLLEPATSFFQKVISTYPQSKYVKKAGSMLAEIAKIQATKSKTPPQPASEKKENETGGESQH